jgi:hypothetical protein
MWLSTWNGRPGATQIFDVAEQEIVKWAWRAVANSFESRYDAIGGPQWEIRRLIAPGDALGAVGASPEIREFGAHAPRLNPEAYGMECSKG